MGSFHLLANMSKWREKNTSKGTIQIQTQCKKKLQQKVMVMEFNAPFNNISF